MSYRRENQSDAGSIGFNRRRPLIFLLIVLCLLFLASYTTRLGYLRGQTRLLEQEQQRVVDAQIAGQRLDSELEHVNSDAYVAETAIEELNMAHEDDTIITLIDPATESTAEADSLGESAGEDAADPAEARVGSTVAGQPTWQQWVDVFRY